MNSHDWFVEHRTDYATRSLDPETERTFADHLRRCAECRDAVAEIEHDLRWLPLAAEPAAVPPGFRSAVLERATGGSRWRWNAMATAAAVAGLLLAGGAWLGGRAAGQRLQQRLEANQAELAAVRDTLSIMRNAGRVMQASITMDGHQGGLLIFADPVTHRWNVVVHGLPPAGPEHVYQFWFIRPDGMVRGATIHSRPGRPALLTMGMPAGNEPVLGAALTLEPMEGDQPKPEGKELAHLML